MNDLGQFSVQVDKAQEELGKKCQTAVADSGYADTHDLQKVDQQGIRVIVPTQMIASGRKVGEFDKRNFRYDPASDQYICPEGKLLRSAGLTRKRKGKIYQIVQRENCLGCRNFGKCTTARNGRKVMRLNAEELRERLEKEHALPENQAIYKRRQEKAELPYGHIKRNLGVSSFLLRGLEGARAEMTLLALCFNLRRMMSLLGYTGIMTKLRGVSYSKLGGQPITRTSQPLASLPALTIREAINTCASCGNRT